MSRFLGSRRRAQVLGRASSTRELRQEDVHPLRCYSGILCECGLQLAGTFEHETCPLPLGSPQPSSRSHWGAAGRGGGRGIQSSRRGTERLPFAGVSVSSEDSPQHTQNPGVGLLPSVARLVQHLTASDTGSRRQLISQQQLPAPAALPRKQSPADHLAVFWVAQKSQ